MWTSRTRGLGSCPPPGLPTSGGLEAAWGQSADPGWTGVRACDLSPLLTTQLRTGSLGPSLQEGRVVCVPGGVAGSVGVDSVRVYGGDWVPKNV